MAVWSMSRQQTCQCTLLMQGPSVVCMCHVRTELFATKLIHHSKLAIEKLLRNLPTHLSSLLCPYAASASPFHHLNEILNADLLPFRLIPSNTGFPPSYSGSEYIYQKSGGLPIGSGANIHGAGNEPWKLVSFARADSALDSEGLQMTQVLWRGS
jgi:hypothetical protein